MDVIIPKNTPYPYENSVIKQTAKDGQTVFSIRVLQGEDEEDYAEYCHELSSTKITGIPAGRAGSEKFTCTFRIDENGILNVSAVSNSVGAQTSELQISQESMKMTQEEVTDAQVNQ